MVGSLQLSAADAVSAIQYHFLRSGQASPGFLEDLLAKRLRFAEP
jgi:hypothetical protein